MRDLKQKIQAVLKFPAHEKFYLNLHTANLADGFVYRRVARVNCWCAYDKHGLPIDPVMSARQVDKLLAAGVLEPCGSLAEPRDAVRLARPEGL